MHASFDSCELGMYACRALFVCKDRETQMKDKPNMLGARASCMPVFVCIGFLGMLMLLCDVVTVQVNTRFIGRGHGRSSGVLSFSCMQQ
jgi:hypothetical protein